MNKLTGEPRMKLSQMQDLGGCRAIMSSIDAVEQLYGGWPALSVVPTLEGAPSKLRLGGGFLCALHDRENSEVLPRPCRPLRFDLHATLFPRQIVTET
jgi:hypothetical protein